MNNYDSNCSVSIITLQWQLTNAHAHYTFMKVPSFHFVKLLNL